jgi:hypothetical protein
MDSAPEPAVNPLRIGIDFDNTLIDYDRVFVEAARELRLVPDDFNGSKRAVRDAIRLLPDGELTWQRLQGHVYGARIDRAIPFAGAREFLRRCARNGVSTFIVSHKTRYGHYDPARIDLREAARDWLTSQGFFNPERGGVTPDQVYFEDDRADKLARIAALGCTHFIDDLPEVFSDPQFPDGVRRILFAETGADCCDHLCPDWRSVSAAVFGDAG